MSAALRPAVAGRRTPRRRRRLDTTLAAAVAAVAAVAAWDAVRTVSEPVAPADGLRALGVAGQLLVSDEQCARRRLALPTLELTEVRRIVGCDVFGHRGSLGIVRGEVGWYAYPGGTTMLLTRRQAERAAGAEARVVAAAWLANTRYAALLERPRSDGRLLGLFDAGRLVRRVAELERGFTELRSSPRGGWFAAVDPGGRVLLFDAAGERAPLPPASERPHAIAWSRDDRVAALADAGGLLLFRPGLEESGHVRVPLRVRDLAWRS